MKKWFYILVGSMTRRFGAGAFYLLVWPLTTCFFILFPRRVAVGCRFYRALYPRASRFYHLWCTWRQYHNFARLFLDRFSLEQDAPIQYTSHGWHHLAAAVADGTGGVILMSHMGSWEMAAYLMRRQSAEMKLMLYMGKKQQEQIGRFIKDGLAQSGIRIMAVDPDGASPFDIVDGLNFLKEGGLMAIAGDRPWSGRERTVKARFLNHEIELLESPHVIALLSGVPVFVFFAFRTGSNQYHFSVSEPLYVRSACRADRTAAIRTSVQAYADRLEQMLRRHPHDWFNFEPFLGERLD